MKFLLPENTTDFYKTGHASQMPEGTTEVYSNWTPRSAANFKGLSDYDGKVVFFGLQGIIQELFIEFWGERFFSERRDVVETRYKRRMDRALGEGLVDVSKLMSLHELGYLPLLVKSLPEGSRVPIRVPLWTIKNTHPDFPWVTNYLETSLSGEGYRMSTSATTAYEYRRLLDRFAEKTGTDPNFVNWQAHDFSMRGMELTAGARSGAAHLLSFLGTDTIPSIDYLERYYGAENDVVGGSVPATEHMVMSMGGDDLDIDTFHRLMTKVYPRGIVSIVSDTWDFWKVLTDTVIKLKPTIMHRDGKVVIRPDSGDPVKIICGNPEAPEGSPECKGAVEVLWEGFGGTMTSEGFKLLDTHIGLIYGDSITLDRANQILTRLSAKGFASGNVVFGVGSFTYAYVTRDTLGQAMKATSGVVLGQRKELFKNPKTDDGLKKSAKGLLAVHKDRNDNFYLEDQVSEREEDDGYLHPIFQDGHLIDPSSLADIRYRLHGRRSL